MISPSDTPQVMHQHALESGALGRALPCRAHGTDPDGLAVPVKHIQAVPRGPAPLEQRLERRSEAEREDAGARRSSSALLRAGWCHPSCPPTTTSAAVLRRATSRWHAGTAPDPARRTGAPTAGL